MLKSYGSVSPQVAAADASLSASLTPLPLPAVRDPSRTGARKPTEDALGTVPLTVLISRKTTLSTSLAELPARKVRASPHVSIRVNAAWLEAPPNTQEKLYFSCTRPQADSTVLAYLPLSPEPSRWSGHSLPCGKSAKRHEYRRSQRYGRLSPAVWVFAPS